MHPPLAEHGLLQAGVPQPLMGEQQNGSCRILDFPPHVGVSATVHTCRWSVAAILRRRWVTHTLTGAQSRAIPHVFRGPSLWAVSMLLNILTLKEVDHSMGASLGQLLHPTEAQRTKDVVA